MDTKQLQEMLLSVAEQLIAQKEYLCKLDSFVGDGDHGLTVERGFKAVEAQLSQQTFEKPAQVLACVGEALVNAMGGAIGPVLGSLFQGGLKKLADAADMGVAEFDTLFSAGLRRIKLIGDSKEGDRTLIDALSPASAAFSQAASQGKDLKQCMAAAADAAAAGADSTKDMVAKRGRAKFLGDASKGYVDAGATTMSLIFKAMNAYIQAM